ARYAAFLGGGIVVASYVFETLRLLSAPLRGWESASVFALQKAGMSLSGEIHPGPIMLLLGLTMVFMVAAAMAMDRRDLTD
nr:hypothetical protein [Candidatus Krumholzibacteria bacterium]